jgi:uncharacterized membrane protein
MMVMKRLFLAVQILAILGITLAIYLLYQQYTLPAVSPCTINETINCDAIISGEVAKTLSIPTPLYGLIGYIVILFAARYQLKKLLLGMTGFGMLFCAWIGYREIFELGVICPVCIACQLIMLSVFTLSIVIFKKRPPV